MIGHQHVGVEAAAVVHGSLVQVLQVAQVVGLLEEAGRSIVAALDHMLSNARQVKTLHSWHGIQTCCSTTAACSRVRTATIGKRPSGL